MRCASTCEHFPSRFAVVAVLLCGLTAAPAGAQQAADASPVVPQQLPDSSPVLMPQPRANQYSSNELLDAGHHFFGDISRGLASMVEKAVSQWGLPNGYILGEERAARSSEVCATAKGGFTLRMPETCECSGRGPRWASTPEPTARGP